MGEVGRNWDSGKYQNREVPDANGNMADFQKVTFGGPKNRVTDLSPIPTGAQESI